MAFSSTISAGDTALAAQYNNLRKDILDTTGGHTHDGTTDGKFISNVNYDLGFVGSSVSDGNIRYGYQTLTAITTQQHNSAFGYQALQNSTGGGNSAFGYRTLPDSINGANSAFGSIALNANTTGQLNSAFGYQSLRDNVSGEFNSAFGGDALKVSTGNSNTAMGYQALFANTASNNSAFGYQALNLVTSGANNTALGYNAQVPTATASNQVRIGDTNVTYAGVQVAWTVTSDSSWKKNIKDIPLGLDFINDLKPVEYNRKNDKFNKKEYGIIAQDLEKTLEKFEVKNAGILTKDDDDKLHLRYNDLLAPMIKAIQEQSKQIENLKKEIEELKNV